MKLIIHSLGGGHTHIHTHTHILTSRTKAISRNQVLQPVRAWCIGCNTPDLKIQPPHVENTFQTCYHLERITTLNTAEARYYLCAHICCLVDYSTDLTVR